MSKGLSPSYQYNLKDQVLKDGHVMFAQDAIKDIQILQRKIEQLEKDKQELHDKCEALFEFIPIDKWEEANQMCVDFGNTKGMQGLVNNMRKKGL